MEYLIRNSYCLIIFLIVIIGCSEKPKNDISKEDTLLKEISKVDSELKEISNLREISKDASERANEEFKNKYGKEPFNAKTDDVFKHDSDWRWYSVVENKPESYVGIVSINRLKKITKVEVFAYRPSCKDVTDSGDDFDYSDYPDLLQPFEAIVEFDTCHEIEVLISYYDSTGYKSAFEAHVSKSTPPDEFIGILLYCECKTLGNPKGFYLLPVSSVITVKGGIIRDDIHEIADRCCDAESISQLMNGEKKTLRLYYWHKNKVWAIKE